MADQVQVSDSDAQEVLSEQEQAQLDADLKELGVEKPEKEVPESKEEPLPDDDSDLHEEDGNTDEEREAIRARRREERQRKKEYRREKEDSYKREIDALKRQLNEVNEWKNVVERRQVDTGIQQIDKALQDSQSTIDLAKQAIAEAAKNQDGEAMVEAQELYYAARKRIDDLSRLKATVAHRMSAPPQQNIDPRVVNAAKKWMEDKPWYDTTGQDDDSRVALMIDNNMAKEGWDPRNPEYWDELDNRLKKYLPHRFTNASTSASINTNEATRRNKPPTSGSSQGRQPTQSEYRLSPERVRAMKEAGMWDDPVKRKRMIQRYMEQDKNQG